MIAWAIETAIATTLLMVLVLAIRKPVREAMGPRFAYLLWVLPALRMLLPPLPESLRHNATAPIATATESIQIYLLTPIVGSPPMQPDAVAGGMGWTSILLAAWLVGTLGFLGYHAIAHGWFCQRLIRCSRRTHAVAEGRVHVLETDAANGPLAFGILRKYVAFPKDFAERYDVSERDLALAHELCHHQRGDLYANWAALMMLAFHWFNPVAWRAYRAFRADQEMACDAVVLAGRPQALRHAYGLAIVKSAHGGAVSAACHLHTINDLKGRLKMLSKNHRISRKRFTAGVAGLAGLTVAALGVTASGTSAAETLRSNVEDSIGVKLADLKLPQMPKPPAAPAAPEAAVAPEAPTAPVAPQSDVPPPPPPPAAGAVPSVPPAPPVPEVEGDADSYVWTSKDGNEVHRYVFRRGDKAALADIPEVSEENCGEGTQTVKVIPTPGNPDKARRMIVCTDRIERISKEAVARSMEAQKVAMKAMANRKTVMRGALNSMRTARSSIAAEQHLTAEERAEALKELDEQIADMQRELADAD